MEPVCQDCPTLNGVTTEVTKQNVLKPIRQLQLYMDWLGCLPGFHVMLAYRHVWLHYRAYLLCCLCTFILLREMTCWLGWNLGWRLRQHEYSSCVQRKCGTLCDALLPSQGSCAFAFWHYLRSINASRVWVLQCTNCHFKTSGEIFIAKYMTSCIVWFFQK